MFELGKGRRVRLGFTLRIVGDIQTLNLLAKIKLRQERVTLENDRALSGSRGLSRKES